MSRPPKNQHVVAVLRQAIGLGQQQLAARIGCSKSYIQKIELDDRPLSLETAKRIGDHTGVDLDWLMAGNYKKPPLAAAGRPLTWERYDRHRAWKEEVQPATDKQMARFWEFVKDASVGLEGIPNPKFLDPVEREKGLDTLEGLEMKLVVERKGKQVRLPKDLQVISRNIAKRLESDQRGGMRQIKLERVKQQFERTLQAVFVHKDADFLLWQLKHEIGEFERKHGLAEADKRKGR